MKKLLLTFLIIGSFSYSSNSQQCTQLLNADVNTTCLALKNLMDCNVKKKEFDKALAVYLVYKHINDNYSPPSSIKQYFVNLPSSTLQELGKIGLTINGIVSSTPAAVPTPISPQKNNQSAMPDIIRTSN